MRRRSFRFATRRHRLTSHALVALVVGLASLAGCGGDGDETAFTPVPGTESAYCNAYRAWQVHELDGGEGDEQSDAAALRKYWNEYLIFEETLLHEAPAEIRDEVAIKVSAIRTVMTPLMEKYGFDTERLRREGTVAERRLALGPPADVQKAQDVQHAYEDRVCGVAPPPAADVVFESDASSRAYCAALRTLNGRFEQGESSRFDPDVVRKLFTADRLHGLARGGGRDGTRRDRHGRRGRERVVPHALERRLRQVRLRRPPHLAGGAPPRIEPCSPSRIPASSNMPPARLPTRSRSAKVDGARRRATRRTDACSCSTVLERGSRGRRRPGRDGYPPGHR